MSAAAVPTSGTDAPVRTHTVIVYSDDPSVRDGVRTAVGRRPASDLGRVEWVECTTGPDLIRLVDAGGVDLVVLDGEAWPTGGLGLARQMKDELVDAPPTLCSSPAATTAGWRSGRWPTPCCRCRSTRLR